MVCHSASFLYPFKHSNTYWYKKKRLGWHAFTFIFRRKQTKLLPVVRWLDRNHRHTDEKLFQIVAKHENGTLLRDVVKCGSAISGHAVFQQTMFWKNGFFFVSETKSLLFHTGLKNSFFLSTTGPSIRRLYHAFDKEEEKRAKFRGWKTQMLKNRPYILQLNYKGLRPIR